MVTPFVLLDKDTPPNFVYSNREISALDIPPTSKSNLPPNINHLKEVGYIIALMSVIV